MPAQRKVVSPAGIGNAKIHWSPNLRGKSTGNFLNPLNSGFKYFLREGKFRDRVRTEYIILGRRQKAKGHSTLTYSFDQLFPRILYKRGTYFLKRGKHKRGYTWTFHTKRGTYFSKRGKHKGGTHSSVIFSVPFLRTNGQTFYQERGCKNKGCHLAISLKMNKRERNPMLQLCYYGKRGVLSIIGEY